MLDALMTTILMGKGGLNDSPTPMKNTLPPTTIVSAHGASGTKQRSPSTAVKDNREATWREPRNGNGSGDHHDVLVVNESCNNVT